LNVSVILSSHNFAVHVFFHIVKKMPKLHVYTSAVVFYVTVQYREFPTPHSGGLILPNFRTPPGFRRKGGRENERKGKGKGREGNGPQGLVDTTHVRNSEKYPGAVW